VWLVPESSKAAGGVLSNETPRVVTDLGAQQTTGLKCYQTICPHLGCGTDFDAARGRFVCPCHASDFDLSGRVLSGPSPRGLDELACRISGPAPDGARWVEVEYREFKTGTAERERLI
jgi:nitrite reductase/ring-hydroxylating ferredoxin subunit